MEVCDIIQYVEKKLLNVYCKDGYKNIKFKTENGSNQGDGFVAIVLRVFVTAQKNGELLKMDAIVKCARSAVDIREAMPMTQFFRREAFFYLNIAPWYGKIQDDLGLPQDFRCDIPYCIKACDKYLSEFIALENLKTKGFGICEYADYKHAEKAFQMLAKFHALSLVFEKSYKTEFDQCKSQINEIFFNNFEEFDSSGLCNYLRNASKKFINCIEIEKYRNIVAKVVGNDICKLMEQLICTGKIKVISHGDFWLNNMFFKYKNGEPVKAIPVDFQIVRYESPMNDLLYFLGASSDAELRRNHFWKLFDVYYDSFKEFITLCGYDVEHFYTYEDMKKELYDQAVYGICSGIFLLPFLTSEEFIEPHQMFNGSYTDCFSFDNDTYRKRVNDLVTDFVAWNFIK